MIEQNAKGDELFDHLRESVGVKVLTREDEKKGGTIRITDYEILESEERAMKVAKTGT